MKRSLFMYLFFFSVLFIIFQYMNEKKIFEDQEKKIASLSKQVEEADLALEAANDRVADLNYFTLQGNENAMTYFENSGIDPIKIEGLIGDVIYENNFVTTGNPMVPFDGMAGPMHVNKVRFLNHKWILTDFTDGKNWGEMLLEYNYTNGQDVEFNTLGSFIYPQP